MTPTNTEALAALSYAEAAKLLANELEYKYQRGIDPHHGEWREAVTLLHSLSAVEAERDALRAALVRARGDINWMLNTGQFLNPEVFDYLDAAMKGTQ